MLKRSVEKSAETLQSVKKGSMVGLTIGVGLGTAVGVAIGVGVGVAFGAAAGLAFSAISRSRRKLRDDDAD